MFCQMRLLIVRKMKSAVVLVLAILTVGEAHEGFGPNEQDWGYVTVREGAHMFWWLFFTTANVQNYTERPLVAWLQGGPGSSSSGYGNFAELGPLNLDLKERNHTWVKDVNVLFIDNPVGTGFSYVDDVSALTTTNREIADDFMELLRGFYIEYPEFISVPFYILSESYGGKMAAEIALVLDQAINEGNISSNFLGVGLGDAWVDPVTIVLEWAPYLLAFGAVDQVGHDDVAAKAEKTKELYDQGLYTQSSTQWWYTEIAIWKRTGGIDFYNILKPISSDRYFRSYLEFPHPIAKPQADDEDSKLYKIMRTVQEELGLNVTWFPQSGNVFTTLREDFMKPVTLIVEEILNTTNVRVAVFNGQLDLIVCTPGTVKWVDNLQWLGSDDWATARRQPIAVNGIYEGFEKEVGNLGLYWVNRAGHMVPSDNPAAMDYILRKLTQDYDGTLQRNEVLNITEIE